MTDRLRKTTMRPGFLVSLKTFIKGNVKYTKTTLDTDGITKPPAGDVDKWETTKFVADSKEHERAVKARSDARGKIIATCIESAFGLLCPTDKAAELAQAVQDARKLVDDFNETAKVTNVQMYVMIGEVAENDVEAARALNAEVQMLMERMEAGLNKLDAGAIRQAATLAKNVGKMLTPKAREAVQEAIDLAREQARKIVKAGEKAAMEVDLSVVNQIAAKRLAFVDMGEIVPVSPPKAAARAILIDPKQQAAEELQANKGAVKAPKKPSKKAAAIVAELAKPPKAPAKKGRKVILDA